MGSFEPGAPAARWRVRGGWGVLEYTRGILEGVWYLSIYDGRLLWGTCRVAG